MNKKLLSGIIAGAALLTLAACGNGNSSSNSSSGSSAPASGKIIAGGSTALQPMAQQASTEYTAKNQKFKSLYKVVDPV